MKNFLFAFSFLTLVSLGAFAEDSPAPVPSLVLNDEFDGPEIDKSRWSFAVGAGGFGNNEM